MRQERKSYIFGKRLWGLIFLWFLFRRYLLPLFTSLFVVRIDWIVESRQGKLLLGGG